MTLLLRVNFVHINQFEQKGRIKLKFKHQLLSRFFRKCPWFPPTNILIIEKTFCFEVNMTDVYGILCVACLHFNFITNRFCCERIVWISTCPFNVGISIRNYILLVFLIHRMIHDIFNNWYSTNKNGLQYIKLEAQVSMYRSPDINKSS
jgi:hypothetical protein